MAWLPYGVASAFRRKSPEWHSFWNTNGWATKGGRVNEKSRVWMGGLAGAVLGAAATYLFFTDRGRQLRDKLEPALGDLQHEFTRFRGTIEQFGHMANDGMRMLSEFNNARGSTSFTTPGTSH